MNWTDVKKRNKKRQSEKRYGAELKGEVCDRHRKNEGTSREWCRHIND